MQPRISLITLGVDDVAASRRFYEKLGFVASPASQAEVAFFQLGGLALALFGRGALADDAHVDSDTSAGTFSGITLAHNCRSEAEVDQTFAHAIGCGATVRKQPEKVFWGGYSGYFADPDGHLWEVAYNPYFPLDAEGRLQLPT